MACCERLVVGGTRRNVMKTAYDNNTRTPTTNTWQTAMIPAIQAHPRQLRAKVHKVGPAGKAAKEGGGGAGDA